MADERRFFEDHFKPITGWDFYWSDIINQYMDHQTNAVWFGWQAYAQRDGYKLVPVETLEECLSWAACASSESWSDEQRDEIDKHCKVIEKAMIGAAP